jgi:predicted nucleic acid-binding protein
VRLYLETSVLGALADREEPRRPELTRELSRRIAEGAHEGVISNVVQEELERAPAEVRKMLLAFLQDTPLELVVEDVESRSLFVEYVELGIVPERYRNDLRHVAVATVAGVDALVSWNFRHLVNIRTRRAVHGVNVRLGYPLIEIVSPEEV